MNNQTIISRIENTLPNPLMVGNKSYILFLINSSVERGDNVRIIYHEKNNKENKPIDLTYCIDNFTLIPTEKDGIIYLSIVEMLIHNCIERIRSFIDSVTEPVIEERNFTKELTELLNRYSKENDSNTPDFILANYLISCLETYNSTIKEREKWYGR